MGRILYFLLLIMAARAAWANGGGYAKGGVTETGTILGFVPEETDKVQIVQEELNVGLTPAEARVEVRYILKNTSGRHVTVRFGFPVEEMAGEDPFVDPAVEKAAKSKAKQRPALQYCRGYRVEVEARRWRRTLRRSRRGMAATREGKG